MRTSLARLGDRLLGRIVPSTDASAGCPPDSFQRPCSSYCPAPYKKARVQNCSYSGNCTLHCGPCYYILENCG